jgi:hypothetical protein
MAPKWFVQKDDFIDGPLSTEEVQARLDAGKLTHQHMVWGKGLPAWQRLQWWQKELTHFNEAATVVIVQETWHFALNGKSFGPFSRDVLIQQLKIQSNLAEVMVWTKGMKEWAPLFEFHDLLSEVGVNKRQFPRADLHGKAVIKTTESTLSAGVLSISEGGCGVQLDSGLVSGQAVSIEIESPDFREILHAKGECRYMAHGVCGIKFTSMNVETRGLIIQFVRQNQTRFVLRAA